MANVGEADQVRGHKLNPAGGLEDLQAWDEDVAEAIAAREGVTLTEPHWQIIHLMRGYYQSFNISPIMKLLKREIRQHLGADKAEAEYLDALFPGGVLDQGIRISGLPFPYLDEELRARMPPPHVVNDDEGRDSFIFEGNVIHLLPSGNIVERHLWNEAMAVELAGREGITLTEGHWRVIHFLRNFYDEYGIAPMVRLLEKHMVESGQAMSKARLYELFPKGPSRQGSRIAGLPNPQGCID